MRVHLDTDIGGDIDDLCALALLLRWPGVEIMGITTVAEMEGQRAGYVRHVLWMAGREDIPVAAGADVVQGWYRVEPQLPDELSFYRIPPSLPDEARYWGQAIPPSPDPPNRAVALLKESIDQGATVIGIGPFTNLYLLERQHPGILKRSSLFLMGGYVYPPRQGFPQWGFQFDYNVQVDVRSAQYVLEHSNPTLVPLAVTVETSLRRAYLERLRNAGKLGQLLVRQAEACAEDERKEDQYGKVYPGLPPDIINFQHDPLACAIALDWNEGVEFREIPLRIEIQDSWLVEKVDPTGKPMQVVTRIDGTKFNQFWLDTICGNS